MHCLIIDDEKNIRDTMRVVLEAAGHASVGVADGDAALDELAKRHFDVAFLDLKLKREDGLEILPKLRKFAPHLDVIICSAHGSIEAAVEAMRGGAADFVEKPFTPEQLRQVVDQVKQGRALKRKVAELESRIQHEAPAIVHLTADPAMQRVYDKARQVAGAPTTVLVLGESGTGKTVLARYLHDQSPQRENTFVTISCGSLSRELIGSELFGHVKGAFTGAVTDTFGKVALADGGTLFFDEIGDMPQEIQPQLLRLLQEREYERIGETKTRRANVRVIAATNRDLAKSVREGKFREDLFFRLNVFTLQMPSLRERRQDLLVLAAEYLRFFAVQCGKKIEGLAPATVELIQNYSWPGNLRELRNAIEHAVIMVASDQVQPQDLPDSVHHDSPNAPDVGARVSLQELETAHIRRVVETTDSMEEAARVLGIDPATLYRKRKSMAAVRVE